MVWSKNPADQAAWVVSGVSGSLTPSSVDVSVINLGGNKLDQYLPVHVDVTTAPTGADTTVTLTTRMDQHHPGRPVAVHRRAVPGGAGPLRRLPGLVAANLPARASHITMTGAGPLAVKGAEGPTWVGRRAGDPRPGRLVDGGHPLPHAGAPRVDDPGALGPDPGRAVDLGGSAFDDSAPTTISW